MSLLIHPYRYLQVYVSSFVIIKPFYRFRLTKKYFSSSLSNEKQARRSSLRGDLPPFGVPSFTTRATAKCAFSPGLQTDVVASATQRSRSRGERRSCIEHSM